MYLLQKHVLFISSTLTGVGRSPFIFIFLEAAQLELLSCSFVDLSMAVLLNAREIGEGGNLAFCFI